MGLTFDDGYTKDYVIKLIDELYERITGDCFYYCETENGGRDPWWMLRLKVLSDSNPIIISDEKEEVSQGEVSRYIDRLPPAVEVVRCKECKYREWIAPCPLGEIIDDDGFCSLGERRSE